MDPGVQIIPPRIYLFQGGVWKEACWVSRVQVLRQLSSVSADPTLKGPREPEPACRALPPYIYALGMLLASPVKALGHLHLSALVFTLTSFSGEFFPCSGHKVQTWFYHFSKLSPFHLCLPQNPFLVMSRKNNSRIWLWLTWVWQNHLILCGPPIISFSSWAYS